MERLFAVSVALLVLCACSSTTASDVAVENAARYYLTQHNLSHESPLKLQSVVRADRVAVSGGSRYDLVMVVSDRYHQLETVKGSVVVSDEANPSYSLTEPAVSVEEVELDGQTFAQKAANHYVSTLNQATSMLMGGSDEAAIKFSVGSIDGARVDGDEVRMILTVSDSSNESRRVGLVVRRTSESMEIVEGEELEESRVEEPTMAVPSAESDVEAVARQYVDKVNQAMKAIDASSPLLSLNRVVSAHSEGSRRHVTLELKGAGDTVRHVDVVVDVAEGRMEFVQAEEKTQVAAAPSIANNHKLSVSDADVQEAAELYVSTVNKAIAALHSSEEAISLVSVNDVDGVQSDDGFRYHLTLTVKHTGSAEAKLMKVTILKSIDGEVSIEDGEVAEEETSVAAATASGPVAVDLNDQHLTQVLGFYTQELSAQLSVPVSVVSVMDAEREALVDGSRYVLTLILAAGKDMETRRVTVMAGSNGMNVVDDKLSSSHDLLEVIGAPEEEKAQVTAVLAAARPSADGQKDETNIGINAMTIAGAVAGVVGVALVVAFVSVQLNKRAASREPVFNPDLEESLL